MCRFLGYVGPPVTLEELLWAPPYSLARQSHAPRFQVHGRVNADGWGVGWYDPARRPEPARYRAPRPMWSDRSFASVAGLVSSGAVVAAVRNATPGIPVDEVNTHPFTSGPWLFTHNGAVQGFLDGVGTALRREVSDGRLGGIEGSTDSEVLFALVLDAVDKGASPPAALADVVLRVKGLGGGRLNLLLSDGQQLAATASGDTLFVRNSPDRVWVASEPFDDSPDWRRVADGSVVDATAGHVSISRLP
jgi:glutamine amidotransferase